MGLGSKHIGTSASKDLALVNFSDWRDLCGNASRDDFISIEGIGEIMADSLVDFFSNDINRSLLESMENLGVILNGNGGNQVPQSLSGMTFVLTGSLKSFLVKMLPFKLKNLEAEYLPV